eukprot:Gregarina_sp_Poly_1__3162@NODE_1898_length_3123_cov_53_729385_g246_i1_p2_GENE_NODE_1898_length_3123_cov_53_729385_g246_i1NODE_1898_length_3123_cov_53_729385_g246_i1_p2_ORF_typecomplete_len229_score13_74_NODE_1898_length_3123_cov_53_729385_g246_i1254940
MILPPGVSPNDPRLKQGIITSEASYITDHLWFPEHRFRGNIHGCLGTTPTGDRLVLSPSQSMELQKTNTDPLANQTPQKQPIVPRKLAGTADKFYYIPHCEICRQLEERQFSEHRPGFGTRPAVSNSRFQAPGRYSGWRTNRPVEFTYQYIQIPRELPAEKTTVSAQPVPVACRQLVPPIQTVGANTEKQWFRLAEDRCTQGPGTYILNRGHGLGQQPVSEYRKMLLT